MKYGRYGLSYFFLRWGLALTFVWIGIDMFRSPDAWLGYVPQTVPFGIPRDVALRLAAGFDVLLGVLLAVRVWPKVVAAAVAAHLAAIMVMNGVDQVLIRDVGLLGAALALLTWPAYYKRSRWKWRRRSSTSPED